MRCGASICKNHFYLLALESTMVGNAAACIRHGAPASHLLTMMNGALLPVMNSCRLRFIFCFIKRSIDPLL